MVLKTRQLFQIKMFSNISAFLRAVKKTFSLGIANLRLKNAYLLRYPVEEMAVAYVTNIVEQHFDIKLTEKQLKDHPNFHFFLSTKGYLFFFCRLYLTIWNIFLARFASEKNILEKHKIVPPKIIGTSVLFFVLLIMTSLRLIKLLFQMSRAANGKITTPDQEAQILCYFYDGIFTDKRNDFFWLSPSILEKQPRVILLVETKSDATKALRQLSDFQEKLKKAGHTNLNVLITHKFNGIKRQNIKYLIRAFKDIPPKLGCNVFVRNVLRLYHIIFHINKEAYEYQMERHKVRVVTSTNFSYQNIILAKSAYDAGAISLYREKSMWGNWSAVYENKVVCDIWISLDKSNIKYIKSSNQFIQKIWSEKLSLPLSDHHTILPETKNNSKTFNILLIGSNLSQNKALPSPQVIHHDDIEPHLKEFYEWVSCHPDIHVFIKEKKKARSWQFHLINFFEKFADNKPCSNITFSENFEGRLLKDFTTGMDAAIAFGTFYPSALDEVSDAFSKEKRLFWDVTGLTKYYPEIKSSSRLTICESFSEIQAYLNKLKDQKKDSQYPDVLSKTEPQEMSKPYMEVIINTALTANSKSGKTFREIILSNLNDRL